MTKEEAIVETSKRILEAYKNKSTTDEKLLKLYESLQKLVEDSKTSKTLEADFFKVVDDYAFRSGEILADVFADIFDYSHIPKELLDNMNLAFDTSQRLIVPAMALNADDVLKQCKTMQDTLNAVNGFGVAYAEPSKDFERYYSICKKLAEYEDYRDGLFLLGKEVTSSIAGNNVTESQKANAERQGDLGIPVTVTRTAERNACKWCKAKAGTFDYSDVKNNGSEVWLRHDNCRCSIVVKYDSGHKARKI